MEYSKNDLLHFCKFGNLEKVKECIKQGIEPNIKDNYPIQLASENNNLKVVKYLTSLDSVDPSANNNYAIRCVSRKGYLNAVKYLVSLESVDPGTDDNYAIRWASRNAHLEVIKYLASLDSVDPCVDDHYTIRCMFSYGHLEMFKYLISIGAYKKGLDTQIDNQIDKCIMERQILIILCLNRKLKCTFDKKTYKLFMKSY